MVHRLDEIAAALGAEVQGDGAIEVVRAAEPQEAGPDDLALAMSPAYADALAGSRARAAVVWPGADWRGAGLSGAIVVPRARLAMARLTRALDEGPRTPPGIHPSAVIEPGAEIDRGAAVGPLCVVGAGARIGPGTRLAGQAWIAAGSVLGADCLIHPGVRVGRGVRIGDRVIVHPNAVIGSDGFSFVTREESNVEKARSSLGAARLVPPEDATWYRIHSLGGVEIGDDVEVGASSTVDAGTIRPTRVGRGTKIDNQVQIGHNCTIGEDCLLCGSVGLAGSIRLGDRVVLGGMTGVSDNLSIGDDVVTGGASKVFSSVPAGRIMMGYPAVPMATHMEMYKALRRLPRFLRNAVSREKPVPKGGASD